MPVEPEQPESAGHEKPAESLPGGGDAALLDGETPKKTKRKLPAHRPPTKRQVETQLDEIKVSHATADALSAHVDVHDKQSRIKQAGREHWILLLLRVVLGLAGLVIVVWWQFRILDIVERQGGKELDIPTPVLLGLITTTTFNVFGFLFIVYRFVFPETPKAEPRMRKRKSKR